MSDGQDEGDGQVGVDAQEVRNRAMAALADQTIYLVEKQVHALDWYQRAVERLIEAGLIVGVPAKLSSEAYNRVNVERCRAAGHPLRVMVDSNGVPHKVVCWCAARSFDVPHPAELKRYKAHAKLVSDLDRCPHGRHRIDDCLSCPGESAGNPHLPAPGEVVGYDMGGSPYYVPSGERPDPLCSTDAPEAWRTVPNPRKAVFETCSCPATCTVHY